MKKTLALILTFIMVLALVPSVAFAVVHNIVSVEIVDDIKTDGCLKLKVIGNDSADITSTILVSGYTIKWEKDGTEVISNAHKNNIADDGSWVNVAYDKGAQANYTVTISKEGTEPKTASMKVDWYDALQNGSFELPALNYNSNPPGKWIYNGIVQTPQSNVPYWKTTASDGRIELGNVKKVDTFRYNNPNYAWYKPWEPQYIYQDEVVTEHFYHCSSAVDGDQIAELNCEGTGALYQDVLTTPGETMNWNLSHRGRNGTDKMALVIAPLIGENGAENITTQKQLEDYIAANAGNSNVLIEYMENGQEWKTESGTFVIPEGQFLTRFFFVAISTSTGDLREGNLLDYVWFSTKPVPPPEGKAQLQIVKNIVGLTEDQAKALIAKELISYTIGNETKNAELENLTFNQEEDLYTATFKTNVEIPKGAENVNVTVTEDAAAARVDDFTLDIVGENPQTVTIEKDGTGVANFTNIYKSENVPQPEIGTIIIKKTVSGNASSNSDEFEFTVNAVGSPSPDGPAYPPKAKANVASVNQTANTGNFVNGGYTFNLKHGGSETIELPAGKYYVEETKTLGYTVTVDGDAASGKIVELKAGETVTLNFKNTKGSTPTPTPYNGGGHGHYHPSATPVPVMVIPPKTGDMTLLQYIARLLGLVR